MVRGSGVGLDAAGAWWDGGGWNTVDGEGWEGVLMQWLVSEVCG